MPHPFIGLFSDTILLSTRSNRIKNNFVDGFVPCVEGLQGAFFVPHRYHHQSLEFACS